MHNPRHSIDQGRARIVERADGIFVEGCDDKSRRTRQEKLIVTVQFGHPAVDVMRIGNVKVSNIAQR